MLEPDTRPPGAPNLPGAPVLDATELEALIDAADERLETASPDLVGVLRRGRAALELELGRLLA